jgi:hypothetical protein
MKYPDYAIKAIEVEKKKIDRSFSIIWGALSPSVERDEILYHLITAKKKLNELINNNLKEEN